MQSCKKMLLATGNEVYKDLHNRPTQIYVDLHSANSAIALWKEAATSKATQLLPFSQAHRTSGVLASNAVDLGNDTPRFLCNTLNLCQSYKISQLCLEAAPLGFWVSRASLQSPQLSCVKLQRRLGKAHSALQRSSSPGNESMTRKTAQVAADTLH